MVVPDVGDLVLAPVHGGASALEDIVAGGHDLKAGLPSMPALNGVEQELPGGSGLVVPPLADGALDVAPLVGLPDVPVATVGVRPYALMPWHPQMICGICNRMFANDTVFADHFADCVVAFGRKHPFVLDDLRRYLMAPFVPPLNVESSVVAQYSIEPPIGQLSVGSSSGDLKQDLQVSSTSSLAGDSAGGATREFVAAFSTSGSEADWKTV